MFALQVMYSKFMVMLTRFTGRFFPQVQPVLFAGAGASAQLAANIARAGHSKLLVITDKILVELGLVGSVTEQLEQAGVSCVIYDGILPDPTTGQVDDGAEMLQREQCDGVLAIGGGSSIDAAKIIALQGTEKISVADIEGFFQVSEPGLPVYVVPTTAGTGSEATMVSVITDQVANKKVFIADTKLTPRMAALDPVLMQSMPAPITAATGMDALTHALESLLSTMATDETRYYATLAAKLIFENLPVAYSKPSNLAARESMALASYYAGAAFTKSNVGYVHGIAHQLGAMYHVPHGVANAVILPHVLQFYADGVPEILAAVAARVGIGEAGQADQQRAQALIDQVRSLGVAIGVPPALDKLRRDDFDEIVRRTLAESHGLFGYPVPHYMRPAQCHQILENLLPAV